MLTDRFDQGLLLASQLHRGHLRKGSGTPYLGHLLAVAAIVLEYGGDEDEAIAALLHDAVEDQGGQPTLDRIREQFGARVADIVEGCTDADTIPKPPWRARKETYLAHLPQADASTRLVSCADKIHNARAIVRDYREIGEALWPRFRAGRDGSLWYYRALADAFATLGPAAPARELARVVEEMEQVTAGPR